MAGGIRKNTLLVLSALFVGLLLKGLLITSSVIPFNSDEAVVGLMARHILQGEAPTFFWGQAYMGSLDAWLIALWFRLFGESVQGVRAVQAGLYALYGGTIWLLARRFYRDPGPANWAIWLWGVPTVLMTTYTTASLGGYGEVLILGNLVLWVGHKLLFDDEKDRPGLWLLLGLIGGVGFWTLGLIVMFLLPVGLLSLKHLSWERMKGWALFGAGFVLGSGPWWWYNFQHNWAALTTLARLDGPTTSLGMRALGLALLGLPTVLGLRPPWSPDFAPWPVLFAGLLILLAAGGSLWRGLLSERVALRPGAGRLLALFCLGCTGIFLFSSYGFDSSGRYLLPLNVVLVMGLAGAVQVAWRYQPRLGVLLLAAVLLVNASETWRTARHPDGITTQVIPITRFDNSDDDELIRFLKAEGVVRGYSSYWVSFRLAFVSGEEIIYAPRLPYREDRYYWPGDDRYPAYSQMADASPQVGYITAQHPELDAALQSAFAARGIAYSEIQIGPYHVFYDLGRAVTPEALDVAIQDGP